MQGRVSLWLAVDAQGAVTDVRVTGGPPMLHAAAMEAGRQWRFDAAWDALGRPVASQVTQVVEFRLR